MRLKGIQIRKLSDETYQVTPLFYGKLGKTRHESGLSVKGEILKDVLAAVLKLIAAAVSTTH
jgi:hypothetical protein